MQYDIVTQKVSLDQPIFFFFTGYKSNVSDSILSLMNVCLRRAATPQIEFLRRDFTVCRREKRGEAGLDT